MLHDLGDELRMRRERPSTLRESRASPTLQSAWLVAFVVMPLATLMKTRGRFTLNATLPIAFDGFGQLEVDLLCGDSRVAVEPDGGQHLADPVAHRSDRRKDQVVRENGYFVPRFLAEDVVKELHAAGGTSPM